MTPDDDEVTDEMIERDVERYLVARCKAVGAHVRKVQWIGRRGAPDRFIFGPNVKPCFVELKRPEGGRLSRQQKIEIAAMLAGEVDVFLVHDVAEVDALMKWAVKQ